MGKRNTSSSSGGRRGASRLKSNKGKTSSADKPYKKYDKDNSKPGREKRSGDSSPSNRPYKKFDKPFGKSPRKDDDSSEGREAKSYRKPPRSESDRPYKKFDKPFGKSPRKDGDSSEGREAKSYRKSPRSESDKPYKKFDKPFGKSPIKDGDSSEAGSYKKFDKPSTRGRDNTIEDSSDRKKGSSYGLPFKRSYDKKSLRKGSDESAEGKQQSSERPARSSGSDKPIYPRKFKSKASSAQDKPHSDSDVLRLNRYIANSGLCSRREADEFIKMGLVTVNGEVVSELGYKVKRSDEVRYEGKLLKAEKPVYILMNKPKGFITTTKDPQERNTVMHIIGSSVKERIYPVGRLDRNTTGLLLLTNDGELADKLMHPSYKAKKIYRVELDRPLTKADFQKILDGVYLEEGRVIVDELAILEDGTSIGIEIHIGWNRVVRRIFEALGYQVVKLDRTVYAGLDKKDLARGQWRFLKNEEIVRLKHYK